MLEIKNLVVEIGKRKILNKINFKIGPGEILVVLGPSGSGKTTLLRCIIGLTEISGGEILFNNLSTNKIGIVFQEFNLWDNLTVLENMILAPQIVQKRDASEVYENSMYILKKVALIEKANSYPYQLSGGQKQRAALARALIMNPDLLLLDEITSSLDPELVASVLKIIKQLAKEKMAMMIVTHNLAFAKEIGDKFLFIEEGQVIEYGGKEIFDKSQNPRINKFVASKIPEAVFQGN